MERASEGGQNSAPIAYYYCSSNRAEGDRSSPDDVLRCIGRQLCRDDPKSTMNEHLYKLFIKDPGKPVEGQNKPSLESLKYLILKLLGDNPATIIVDALDELDERTRYELLRCLDQIVTMSPNVVKVFLASRNDGGIVCRLNSTPNIYISAQKNKADTERFISLELGRAVEQKRPLHGGISESLQDEINRTLSDGAQGM